MIYTRSRVSFAAASARSMAAASTASFSSSRCSTASSVSSSTLPPLGARAAPPTAGTTPVLPLAGSEGLSLCCRPCRLGSEIVASPGGSSTTWRKESRRTAVARPAAPWRSTAGAPLVGRPRSSLPPGRALGSGRCPPPALEETESLSITAPTEVSSVPSTNARWRIAPASGQSGARGSTQRVVQRCRQW